MGSYGKYLPDILDEYIELQKLDAIESILLDEALELKNKMIQNQWIESADFDGLKRFANIASVTQNIDDFSLEELREYIFFIWNNSAPYTYEDLVDWLDSYCGVDMYQINFDYNKYYLRIVVELSIEDKIDFIYEKIRAMVPANIVVDVHGNYNKYGYVGEFRNVLFIAKQLTHRQMKTEKFEDFDFKYELNKYREVSEFTHKLFRRNDLSHKQVREDDLNKYDYNYNTYDDLEKFRNNALEFYKLFHEQIREDDLSQYDCSYDYNSYDDLEKFRHDAFELYSLVHDRLRDGSLKDCVYNNYEDLESTEHEIIGNVTYDKVVVSKFE